MQYEVSKIKMQNRSKHDYKILFRPFSKCLINITNYLFTYLFIHLFSSLSNDIQKMFLHYKIEIQLEIPREWQ